MPEHPQAAMDAAIKDGFKPDWTSYLTPEAAEADLSGFKWKGTGWYVTKSADGRTFDTLLVTPAFRGDNVFAFHVWNGRSDAVHSAFSWIVFAPTRRDDRGC